MGRIAALTDCSVTPASGFGTSAVRSTDGTVLNPTPAAGSPTQALEGGLAEVA
jgi:hypothetical protein